MRAELQIRTGEGAGVAVTRSSQRIAQKMLKYIGIFILLWFFGLLNRITDHFNGFTMGTMIFHAVCVPLQGFCNAMVYGGLYDRIADEGVCNTFDVDSSNLLTLTQSSCGGRKAVCWCRTISAACLRFQSDM